MAWTHITSSSATFVHETPTITQPTYSIASLTHATFTEVDPTLSTAPSRDPGTPEGYLTRIHPQTQIGSLQQVKLTHRVRNEHPFVLNTLTPALITSTFTDLS